MTTDRNKLKRKEEKLIEQLRKIGEFRRGSINVIYRKCGKPRCVCNQEGHPGHGPQTTLTFKKEGKSRIRNLPVPEAVALVREQIKNHDLFLEWRKRWQDLNEEEADLKLEQILTESGDEEAPRQKKLRRRSKRKSSGRSRG